MDSNHRRLRQLSYSQPHLATLVMPLIVKELFLFAGTNVCFFSVNCKIFDSKNANNK